MTAAGASVTQVTPFQILEQWRLVEGAFHGEFGIDLSELVHVKTWRWFWVRVEYLLRCDNALTRHFAPTPEPPAEETPTFDWS